MKRLVWIFELALALGGIGACGDDLGTPKPDAAGPDGGKSQIDGGGSSEAGHPAIDSGDKSEANPVADGAVDHGVVEDSGTADLAGAADVGTAVDVGTAADAPKIFDVAGDSVLHPVSVDGGTVDTGSLLDSAGDYPSGVDGGIVDLGNVLQVEIDSLGPIDGLELSSVIPANGEQFDPPLPNASSLPLGVWYCDMGTVHWAQGEPGTGKCPICGMELVQKA